MAIRGTGVTNQEQVMSIVVWRAQNDSDFALSLEAANAAQDNGRYWQLAQLAVEDFVRSAASHAGQVVGKGAGYVAVSAVAGAKVADAAIEAGGAAESMAAPEMGGESLETLESILDSLTNCI